MTVTRMPQTSVRGVREQIDLAHSPAGLQFIRDNPNRPPRPGKHA